jgi:hypothetical protein
MLIALGQHTDRPSGGARQGTKACVATPEYERFVKLQEPARGGGSSRFPGPAADIRTRLVQEHGACRASSSAMVACRTIPRATAANEHWREVLAILQRAALSARCKIPKEAPNASLFLPRQRPISQHLRQPQPLGLPPVQDPFHDVRRKASERQEPAYVGVRDALLLSKVGDRLGLTALDPAPPAVRAEQAL